MSEVFSLLRHCDRRRFDMTQERPLWKQRLPVRRPPQPCDSFITKKGGCPASRRSIFARLFGEKTNKNSQMNIYMYGEIDSVR